MIKIKIKNKNYSQERRQKQELRSKSIFSGEKIFEESIKRKVNHVERDISQPEKKKIK